MPVPPDDPQDPLPYPPDDLEFELEVDDFEEVLEEDDPWFVKVVTIWKGKPSVFRCE